jgi:hypothetical protein
VSKSEGISGKGEKTKGTLIFTMAEDKPLTAQTLDRTVDGNSLPDSEVVSLSRIDCEDDRGHEEDDENGNAEDDLDDEDEDD